MFACIRSIVACIRPIMAAAPAGSAPPPPGPGWPGPPGLSMPDLSPLVLRRPVERAAGVAARLEVEAALESLQLDTATAMNILMTVSTYVMGAALRELREMRAKRDLEQSGFDEAQAIAGMALWRKRLEADGRFSHFLAIIEDDLDPDAEETRTERFEFGLDCVLDGIATQVQRRPGGAVE